MTGDEDQRLQQLTARRLDEAERELHELRSFRDKMGDPERLHAKINKIDDFHRVIKIALGTIFATVISVSNEGWELLRKIFTR